YAIALCRALEPFGIDIALAAMGPGAGPADSASLPGNTSLTFHPCKLEWMHDCEADVRKSGEWLLRLARAHDVDLVHVNGYAHAALPFGQPVVAVSHSDVVSWCEAVHREPPPDSFRHYQSALMRG